MKKWFKGDLNSVFALNSVLQMAIFFLLATAVSEFRVQILQLPYKSPLIILILILSVIGASAAMTITTKTEVEEISRLTRSMGDVASGNFNFHLETKSALEEVREAYNSFNTMVAELNSIEILQSDFVSNVSHEFKTPINVIDGYLTLLKDPSLTQEERELYIEYIQANTRRLADLVGNVLLLSKLENQAINKKEFYSLDEQIRCAILALEPKWTEKDLELDLRLDSVSFFGTEKIMTHVWSNLIGNAIKFNKQGGYLGVRLWQREGVIFAIVEDSGPGIPEEAKERIFEKFYQVDSSHSGDGNGLGLALAKRVLAMHGGSISVENRATGGARFTVVLPGK